MPSTGNPWLERNQREEKVAVKQSQALQHQMPFIHTLLLFILLFFLFVHLSSCKEKRCGAAKKSLGRFVWSRTAEPYRPGLFSPPLSWQTFALRLKLGPTLGFGNANQRRRAGPGAEQWKGTFPGSLEAKREPLAKTNNRIALRDSLLGCFYWYAQVEKHQPVFSKDKRRAGKKGWRGVLSICGCEGVNGKKERRDCEGSLLLFCCISILGFGVEATTVKQKLLRLVSNFFSTGRCGGSPQSFSLGSRVYFLAFLTQKQLLGHFWVSSW